MFWLRMAKKNGHSLSLALDCGSLPPSFSLACALTLTYHALPAHAHA